MIVLTVVLAILGVLILAIGIAGAARVLPGNSMVGLRIPEVRKSEEMWVLGHRIAGPAWIGAGVALVLAAMVSANVSGFLWLIVALLVVGAVVLWGMGAGLAAHALANLDAKRISQEASSADGCCSSGGCGGGTNDGVSGGADTDVSTASEPTAAECASGNACGSCSLNGACEGGGAAFAAGWSGATQLDLDAARRAAEAQDQR